MRPLLRGWHYRSIKRTRIRLLWMNRGLRVIKTLVGALRYQSDHLGEEFVGPLVTVDWIATTTVVTKARGVEVQIHCVVDKWRLEIMGKVLVILEIDHQTIIYLSINLSTLLLQEKELRLQAAWQTIPKKNKSIVSIVRYLMPLFRQIVDRNRVPLCFYL